MDENSNMHFRDSYCSTGQVLAVLKTPDVKITNFSTYINHLKNTIIYVLSQ